MSQENVERCRQALDAFNRRDRAAWLAVCDPEVEDIPPREWPESRPTRGSEAVWALYVTNNAIWEGAQFEYLELTDAGNDKAIAKVQANVRGMASGAGVEWSLWQVVTLLNAKLRRIEWFADRAEALEAAGVSE